MSNDETDRPEKPMPTIAEVLRPVQLLAFAGILGVFVGVVVVIATRDWPLAGIGFGIAFIVGLVGLAMFALAVKPNADEQHQLDASAGHPADRPDAGDDPDQPK
ncbi:hypothetical protein [Gryllotalpicola sp.]|uniref:hypothetical protein n=1 Tax=Gryllotalpicola sp. TaxID=1932787 RepID=UPI002613B042|nr:hypothetical protein [Gryllotalpicola sp.]